MTHQPSEAKSESGKFKIFPNFYDLTVISLSPLNFKHPERVLEELSEQRKNLNLEIAGNKYTLSLSSATNNQKLVDDTRNLQEQVWLLESKIRLVKQCSDSDRLKKYDVYYQKIFYSPANPELEKECLKEWDLYNREMDKNEKATAKRTVQPATPVEKKTTPPATDLSSLDEAIALSKLSFIAENKKRREEEQRDKEIGNIVETYKLLKEEGASHEAVMEVLEVQMGKLKLLRSDLEKIIENSPQPPPPR